uniref:Carboxypeptidase regulatory-like domain-containing protein n=1 Tax=Romanomermis culicivorax TaxID=13658 RepID=A0A915J5T9_ROMCU
MPHVNHGPKKTNNRPIPVHRSITSAEEDSHSHNNTAVQGATVTIRRTFLRSSNLTTTSDDSGYFRLSALLGPYELKIFKERFNIYKQNIHVRDDQRPRLLKIYLTPIAQRIMRSTTSISHWPLISVIIVSSALLLGSGLCLYAYCAARSSGSNKTTDYFRQGFRPLINKRRGGGEFNRNVGNGFAVEYYKIRNTDDDNSLGDDSEEDDVIMLNKDAKTFPSKTNYLNRRSSDDSSKLNAKNKISGDWLRISDVFADDSDDEHYAKNLSVKA